MEVLPCPAGYVPVFREEYPDRGIKVNRMNDRKQPPVLVIAASLIA